MFNFQLKLATVYLNRYRLFLQEKIVLIRTHARETICHVKKKTANNDKINEKKKFILEQN